MIIRILYKAALLLSVCLSMAGCALLISDQATIQLSPEEQSTNTSTVTVEIAPETTRSLTLVTTPDIGIPVSATKMSSAEPEQPVVQEIMPTATVIPEPFATLEPIPTQQETVEIVSIATNAADLPKSLASPSTDAFGDLRAKILAQLTATSLATVYPQEAIQLTDSLLAHLHEFKLTTLGITTERMQSVLAQDRTGDRINALVQEVWDEWVLLSTQQGFGVRVMDPSLERHGISPFRQLTIRLIQGRQATLTDSQQHALYGFFSRNEQDVTWRNDMDSIIGAVNRESFLWSYPQ